MNRFFKLLLLFIITCVGVQAQDNKRKALTDSLTSIGIKAYRQNISNAITEIIEKNKNIDPITAEAMLWEASKNMAKQMMVLRDNLTVEQLEDSYRFQKTESYRRCMSKQLNEAFSVFLTTEVLGNILSMIAGTTWKPKIPELNDKEYDALADKYISQMNINSAFEGIIKPITEKISKEHGRTTVKLIESLYKSIQRDLPKYYKHALVDYVSKEQLQELINHYNKPYIKQQTQDVIQYSKSLVDNKNLNEFAEQTKAIVNNTQILKDTSAVVLEYIKQITSISNNDDYFELIRPIKTLPMKKNATYTGQTRDGLPYGKGVLTDKKGIRYSGYFKDGMRHGVITTYYTNGDSITQVWAEDKVMKKQNNNINMPVPIYNEEAMGYGSRNSSNNQEQEKGIFIDDNLVKGQKIIADNGGLQTHSGLFENGLLTNGQIKVQTNSMDIKYDVEYRYGYTEHFMKGTATRLYKGEGKKWSRIEKGYFKNYELDGNGSTEYKKEDYTYTESGYYAYGYLYGKGHRTRKWEENNRIEVYDGDFFKGSYQGKGVLRISYIDSKNNIAVTRIIDGQFYNNKPNGNISTTEYLVGTAGRDWTFERYGFKIPYSIAQSTTEGLNSDTTEINIKGVVTNNELNGPAEITLSNGDYYKGEFYYGNLKQGTARVTNSDGSIYEGEMKNNEYNGKGKLTAVNGICEEGTFMYGHIIDGVRKNKRGAVISKIR